MIYRAIGIFHHHDQICISFSEFNENAGQWNYELICSEQHDTGPDADDITEMIPAFVQRFIEQADLVYKVGMISLHSYSGMPPKLGATLAGKTGLPVITHLPELDLALGGNGDFIKFVSDRLKPESAVTPVDGVTESVYIAFLGILRWREEYNFLSSVTGASRNSIGGALWMGQEA